MEIDRVLELSCLTLCKEEKELFSQQFSQIIDFFDELSLVDTEGVEPLVTPIDLQNVLRKDEAHLWKNRQKALEQTSEREGSLFKVPPVVS